MTNKTRMRVARIVAGAVIAAGASLTAAGAASAVDADAQVSGGLTGDGQANAQAEAHADDEGLLNGLLGGLIGGGGDKPEEPELPTPPDDEPTEPPTEEPTEPPAEDPTEPPAEEPTTPDDPGNGNGGGTGGGEDGTGTDNAGSQPIEQGDSQEEIADTPGQAQDDAPQGGGQQDPALADTGSDNTSFLLIGAATMIAGGVGFRLLPRLINRDGGAAA